MAMSMSSRRGMNFPVEMTSFVGRRHELADVRRSLSEYRLVTLTGVGGVGKTRLALRVAGVLSRSFRDGVWSVDLADVNDPVLIAPTVAASLGLRHTSGTWQVSRLAEHLADMQALLVLDNCEHVVDQCAKLVDGLLRSCPMLRVLATSRQVLGVDGERIIRVPSLSVPDPDRPAPAAKALQGYESVSLLAQRAVAVLPGFEVGPDNREAVARLCQRLDGIPLAIELAAIRLRALSVQQVLDRLDERYGLLQAGRACTTPRQQTLRALIDWSFDLLSVQEQLLWARVSVFAGGFALDAAEQVCADDLLPIDTIAGLVARLVDKSVVIREGDSARTRFRLLETIREYGRDRLRESGEEAALRRRHRNWCRHLVSQAEDEQFGPEQQIWHHRLRAEHSNLRAALDYSLTEPGGPSEGLRIATALQYYWIFGGALGEGSRWLKRLLAVDSTPGQQRTLALVAAARLAILQEQMNDAVALLAEGRALVQQFGDDTVLAQVTYTEGLIEMFRGHLPHAVGLFEQVLAKHRATGDLFGTALALNHLGSAWMMLDDTGRAEAYCREVLALSEAHGERWRAAHACYNLAYIAWRQGDMRQAADLGMESIRMRQSFGFRYSWGVAISLELLAWVAHAQGENARAARLFGVVQAAWHAIGASLPPPLIGEHNQCETQTRNALGRHAFETAFREGQALTLDDGVPYALGETPDQGPAHAEHEGLTTQLTRRETEVAGLVAEGLSNKEIAARLVLSPRTVECHIQHILTKLGFTSRAQIAAMVGDAE